MPTYWSRTLIPTARQVPAEAQVPSHQLMLRAGLVRQLGAGMYSYLPLGLRCLHKVTAIVRQEMDAAGAVEVFLPTLQPIELWEQTGRRTDYGQNLFVIEDRHGRQMALGPTHEEVVTDLAKAFIDSYRQLPITLYQIQTKFRDEYRPRFGVLRSREFQMKDAYSFDLTIDGLDKSYQAMYDAYCRIFGRCGLPYEIVEAESGPIGGSASHEFMVPSPTGEDVILKSDKGNYAANVEKCAIGRRPVSESFKGAVEAHGLQSVGFTPAAAPTGELDMVHTPGCASIADVCKFMKVKPRHMLKTLVCQSEHGVVVAVVRGDHDLNEAKLRATCGSDVELADDDLARKSHFAIGYVGPHVVKGRDDITLVVDHDAAQDQFWASGANEVDHHVKHFNWHRDVIEPLGDDAGKRLIVADIRNAVDGDPSPMNDGGVLQETHGIEVGHVFKLGTKYTKALGFGVLDVDNQRKPVIMGCYGIGINRIIAGAIERNDPQRKGHDDNGIIWPPAIAPFTVIITVLKYERQAKDVADQIAAQLEVQSPKPKVEEPNVQSPKPQVQESAGPSPASQSSRLWTSDVGLWTSNFDVLIDDRDERPGVKFKDADLIGIPVRITIGERALKDGNVEVKSRTADQPELVPIAQAAARAAELLAQM